MPLQRSCNHHRDQCFVATSTPLGRVQADFYTFPHVILFDSWEDLVVKLQTIDLRAVSAAMHEYNARQVRVQMLWAGSSGIIYARAVTSAAVARCMV
jgi:hypothetical protein